MHYTFWYISFLSTDSVTYFLKMVLSLTETTTDLSVFACRSQNFEKVIYDQLYYYLTENGLLQSIYVTRDRVILKFKVRVQIYMAVLNICCEIQNSDRSVVRFSKINSYGISFWLVLFKNMRNIRFLGVW